jgi:hypothetical protein
VTRKSANLLFPYFLFFHMRFSPVLFVVGVLRSVARIWLPVEKKIFFNFFVLDCPGLTQEDLLNLNIVLRSVPTHVSKIRICSNF